jgi:pilus assembly protein CpaB
MKPKTLILIVVAVGCGLAASYMTAQLLAERNTGEGEGVEEKVNVLVAKDKLQMGQLITNPRALFKLKAYSKSEVPTKAILVTSEKDWDLVKDRRLVKPLSTDQFLSQEDLLDKNQNNLSIRLPKNMRAVGIKVNPVSIAGGFSSLPMSRVDILSTIRRGDGDSISQVLLKDVLVLAADDRSQRDPNRETMMASTVTVALSPQDALIAKLAEELGTLSLVLRPDGLDGGQDAKTEIVRGDLILKGQARELEKPFGGKTTIPSGPGGGIIRTVPDIDETKAAKKVEVKQEPKVVVKGEPQVEVKPEPKTRTHVLTIYNGPDARRFPYTVDDKGQLVDEEITRAESEPKPPAPPAPKKESKKPAPPKTLPEAPKPSPQGQSGSQLAVPGL